MSYKITAKFGNQTFTGMISEDDLSPEQIEAKARDIFRDAFVMSKAKKELKNCELVDGKTIANKSSLAPLDSLGIEYEEILPPAQEEEARKEKIYELSSMDGLTRAELIEQKILCQKKLEKIKQAITDHELKEHADIENSLTEIEGGL